MPQPCVGKDTYRGANDNVNVLKHNIRTVGRVFLPYLLYSNVCTPTQLLHMTFKTLNLDRCCVLTSDIQLIRCWLVG